MSKVTKNYIKNWGGCSTNYLASVKEVFFYSLRYKI